MLSFLFKSSLVVSALSLALLTGEAMAQQAKQASAGPISDLLNGVGAPKIGYAPGVQQAVANTGAQPNPFNLFPGLGGGQAGSAPGGNALLQPLQQFAQAGQQAFSQAAAAGGQLFNAALQPLQQLAQGGQQRG